MAETPAEENAPPAAARSFDDDDDDELDPRPAFKRCPLGAPAKRLPSHVTTAAVREALAQIDLTLQREQFRRRRPEPVPDFEALHAADARREASRSSANLLRNRRTWGHYAPRPPLVRHQSAGSISNSKLREHTFCGAFYHQQPEYAARLAAFKAGAREAARARAANRAAQTASLATLSRHAANQTHFSQFPTGSLGSTRPQSASSRPSASAQHIARARPQSATCRPQRPHSAALGSSGSGGRLARAHARPRSAVSRIQTGGVPVAANDAWV